MRNYSAALIKHFQSPKNVGRFLQTEQVYTGTCGLPSRSNYIELSLQVINNQVHDARFKAHGCAATIAVCSCLTELLKGKSVSAIKAITADTIAKLLDLPTEKYQVAALAEQALEQVLHSIEKDPL